MNLLVLFVVDAINEMLNALWKSSHRYRCWNQIEGGVNFHRQRSSDLPEMCIKNVCSKSIEKIERLEMLENLKSKGRKDLRIFKGFESMLI